VSDRRPVVVAYTTGHDEYAPVRLAAIEYARDHDAQVILYAADAASAISEPMPNQWGSEGEGDDLGDRLTVDDLEYLGQAQIATQVREARAGGVDAYGWLPKDQGPDALVDYAEEQQAERLFVPAKLDSIDELNTRLAGEPNTTETPAKVGIRLVRVDSEAV
jgi:hypothetical protein